MLHPRQAIVLIASIVTSTIAISAAPAFAFFHAGASATASATLAALAAPENVRADVVAGATTAHVTWTAGTPIPGTVPDGYRVARIASGSSSSACGTSSAKLLGSSANTCDDTGVADGTYTYQVTAVFRSWTRAGSPSAPVQVARDVTAPDADFTFPEDGHLYGAGQFGTGCATSGFCGTASDASGVQSVDVSYSNGSGWFWDGHGFNSASEVFFHADVASPGATTTSWSYAIAAPAIDGNYYVKVRAIDVYGNVQTPGSYAAKASMQLDTTAPTVTSVVLKNGGTSGRADPNDTIAITFSEALSVKSICPAWAGDTTNHSLTASNDVTVTIANNGTNDRLSATATSCGS
jgi:hypothetical protein